MCLGGLCGQVYCCTSSGDALGPAKSEPSPHLWDTKLLQYGFVFSGRNVHRKCSLVPVAIFRITREWSELQTFSISPTQTLAQTASWSGRFCHLTGSHWDLIPLSPVSCGLQVLFAQGGTHGSKAHSSKCRSSTRNSNQIHEIVSANCSVTLR